MGKRTLWFSLVSCILAVLWLVSIAIGGVE